MIKRKGTPKAECGTTAAAARSLRPAPIRHSSFVIRHSRPGLTLIELLVTIVIMVTVLAGVLPLVSPNNNSRKLREASRQLNSLLSQAQAQAARDGRPVGVSFRESGNGNPFYSGMALEAYIIAEPQPFAGFSEFSRVAVFTNPDNLTYGIEGADNPTGNGGTLFEPKHHGKPLWSLQFTLYGQQDPIPPRMVRIGDVLDVSGNLFLIADDPKPSEEPNEIDPDSGYVVSTFELRGIWLNNSGQQLSPGPKAFTFKRQPMNTPGEPLQFPRGIGIDMEGSGATGLGSSIDFDVSGATTIGIMFSPNGSIDAVYRDGTRLEGIEQIYLLVGLFENGNNSNTFSEGYDFIGFPVSDAAELTTRRGQINWLSGDSRWVTVNRAGRIITAENNISFDPSSQTFLDAVRAMGDDDLVRAQRNAQRGAARNLAENMSGSTGK